MLMNEQKFQQSNKLIQNQNPKNVWIIITVIITALIVGGGVYVWQQLNLKSTEQSLRQQIIDLENQIKFIQSTDKTVDRKFYRDDEYGFEMNYPLEFGQIIDKGKNTYLLNNFEFSGEKQRISLVTFTDKSVSDWETAIRNSISNNEPIGDPAMLSYPLSVKTLLISKSVGYNCTTDFGLNEQSNESCQIVDVNGTKAFKIIATGPFQSETSELKYIFYVNDIWFDFSKGFWVYSKDEPDKQLYTYKQLNSMLQGKTTNISIRTEIDIFEQILSTFKFAK